MEKDLESINLPTDKGIIGIVSIKEIKKRTSSNYLHVFILLFFSVQILVYR